MNLSVNKIVAITLRNASDIILVDYLQNGKQRMANIMPPCWTSSTKIFFHHDNARVNTCVVAVKKFNELGYEFFLHLEYYLKLVSSH